MEQILDYLSQQIPDEEVETYRDKHSSSMKGKNSEAIRLIILQERISELKKTNKEKTDNQIEGEPKRKKPCLGKEEEDSESNLEKEEENLKSDWEKRDEDLESDQFKQLLEEIRPKTRFKIWKQKWNELFQSKEIKIREHMRRRDICYDSNDQLDNLLDKIWNDQLPKNNDKWMKSKLIDLGKELSHTENSSGECQFDAWMDLFPQNCSLKELRIKVLDIIKNHPDIQEKFSKEMLLEELRFHEQRQKEFPSYSGVDHFKDRNLDEMEYEELLEFHRQIMLSGDDTYTPWGDEITDFGLREMFKDEKYVILVPDLEHVDTLLDLSKINTIDVKVIVHRKNHWFSTWDVSWPKQKKKDFILDKIRRILFFEVGEYCERELDRLTALMEKIAEKEIVLEPVDLPLISSQFSISMERINAINGNSGIKDKVIEHDLDNQYFEDKESKSRSKKQNKDHSASFFKVMRDIEEASEFCNSLRSASGGNFYDRIKSSYRDKFSQEDMILWHWMRVIGENYTLDPNPMFRGDSLEQTMTAIIWTHIIDQVFLKDTKFIFQRGEGMLKASQLRKKKDLSSDRTPIGSIVDMVVSVSTPTPSSHNPEILVAEHSKDNNQNKYQCDRYKMLREMKDMLNYITLTVKKPFNHTEVFGIIISGHTIQIFKMFRRFKEMMEMVRLCEFTIPRLLDATCIQILKDIGLAIIALKKLLSLQIDIIRDSTMTNEFNEEEVPTKPTPSKKSKKNTASSSTSLDPLSINLDGDYTEGVKEEDIDIDGKTEVKDHETRLIFKTRTFSGEDICLKALQDKYDFKKELEMLQLLRKMQAPNSIQLLGYFKCHRHFNDFRFILVFPWLNPVPSPRHLTLACINQWMMEFFQFLKVIHSYGIAHLDLKVTNVMINRGSLVVIDFGQTKEVGFKEKQLGYEETCGTGNFRAPEIHLFGRYGIHSDIFSAGMVLLSLLDRHLRWDRFYDKNDEDQWKVNPGYRLTDNAQAAKQLLLQKNSSKKVPTLLLQLCEIAVEMIGDHHRRPKADELYLKFKTLHETSIQSSQSDL